jgi:hypothetical protein
MPNYDYIATKKDIAQRFDAILQPALLSYKKCVKGVLTAENHPAAGLLDPSTTMTLADGVLIELITAPVHASKENPAPPAQIDKTNEERRKLRQKIDACSDKAGFAGLASLEQEYEDNEKRGRQTKARVPRMIIHDRPRRRVAQSLRGVDWLSPQVTDVPGADALLVEVSTFSGLREQFERSRFVNELMLLFSGGNADQIRLRNEAKSLSSLATDWSAVTKLHADDYVQLRVTNLDREPIAEEQVRKLVGAGKIYAQPDESRKARCYTPYPVVGDEDLASALGIIAHVIVQEDFRQKFGLTRDRGVYFDDGFGRPKRYGNFIINKNLRSLNPLERKKIRDYRGKRPDILVHSSGLIGYEEIRPKNAKAIAHGVDKLQEIQAFMSLYALPYKLGTPYQPPKEIPVIDYLLPGGEVVEVYLEVGRDSGLIVYKYCFRADWERIKTGIRLAFEWFIQILAVLLWLASLGKEIKDPVFVPPVAPELPPINPSPPVLDPAPPDRVPVTNQPEIRVPANVMKSLRGISTESALQILSQDTEIVWEPALP